MKCIIRSFELTDISTRVDWINNPIINKTMFFELPATIEKTSNWYEMIKNNPNRMDITVIDVSDNTLCAMGGFNIINRKNSNAEFYLMVNPHLIGKGLGIKVTIWLNNYAFHALNLHKIYLFTDISNIAGNRLYEKCGYKLEGILKEHIYKSNKFYDLRQYGLLKSEWECMPWSSTIINNYI